jgi:hypothetical protein
MNTHERAAKLARGTAPESTAGARSRPNTEPGTLFIPQRLLRRFQKAGIKCFSLVETHQRSDGQLVVRGIESGGAVINAGHYVTFCDDVGESVPGHCFYTQGLGFNARHAIVVAPSLVKIEMIREGHVYHLLITKHTPDPSKVGTLRPTSLAETIFYSSEGYLEEDLVQRDKGQRGILTPQFFSMAGESLSIPVEFMAATRAITGAASCVQCRHAHYVGASSGRPLNS